ncbi:hypothetical protein HYW46_03700 [Candidatus Daviesbacteria bacterium]|nr:hypothetical protein [Candidatus Daviesbacteria bacterium]
MGLHLESKHTRVQEIGLEGRYQISTDPDEGQIYKWPNEYFIPGDPFALPTKLIEHLAVAFPDTKRLQFKPAHFSDGCLKAAELDYKPGMMDLTKWGGGDSGYLDLDGHVTLFELGKSSDKYDSSFRIKMQDCGNLKIVKNSFEFTQSQRRDGKLSTITFGQRGSEEFLGRMIGYIEISGKKPGELVASSLEFIREFTKEHCYPIWRKP